MTARKMRSVLPDSVAGLHLDMEAKANASSRAPRVRASIRAAAAVAMVARSKSFVRLARGWNIHRLLHVSLALVRDLAQRNETAVDLV